MKKIVLILLLVSGGANASNWELAGMGPTASVFIDKNSISNVGKYRKAWVKYSFASDQEGSSFTGYKKWRSSTDLIYFQCEEKTSGTVQATYYDDVMSSGQVVASINLKLSQVTFTESAPDTLGDAVTYMACNNAQSEAIGLKKKK